MCVVRLHSRGLPRVCEAIRRWFHVCGGGDTWRSLDQLRVKGSSMRVLSIRTCLHPLLFVPYCVSGGRHRLRKNTQNGVDNAGGDYVPLRRTTRPEGINEDDLNLIWLEFLARLIMT